MIKHFLHLKSRQFFYALPHAYLRIVTAIASGTLHKGRAVEQLEGTLSTRFKAKHAIAVPQARMGIYLALKHLKPANKTPSIILSPYTIADVINMVVLAGYKPVFADIDPHSTNIDLTSAKALIDENTTAIMITHLHGIAADASAFKTLCETHNLVLLEDCAQAFSVKQAGSYVGTFGTVGIYSFGMAKNINTLYGGAVITNNDVLAASIRNERNSWPWFDNTRLIKRSIFLFISNVILSPIVFRCLTFWIFRFGWLHGISAINNAIKGEDVAASKNALPDYYRRRFTPAQARLALAQLPHIERYNQERLSYAKLYQEELKDCQAILQPTLHEGDITLTYPVVVPNRKACITFFMQHNHDIAAATYHNLADAACFANYKRDCPNARRVAAGLLYLPCYPGYSRKSALRTIALLRSYLEQNA